MAFLHGIETVELTVGPRQVQQVRSSVIGLIGTAPIQDVANEDKTINKPIIITNDKDAARYFGQAKAGYSIPAALRAIQASGFGTVIVVNVFDPAKHLDKAKAPDPSTVTSAEIIGAVDGSGNRTGAQALLDARSLFGFEPRILISPACDAVVGAGLEVLAGKLRGVALLDAPAGLTVQQAIAARAANGTMPLSSDRACYCYPRVKVADPATGQPILEPLSQHMAGIMAKTDQELGYWWSPSNKAIPNVIGLERPLTARTNDLNSEVNLLNAAGIMTVFADFGTGFKLWGNRASSFPAKSSPTTFLCVRRTADIIEDSMEQASVEFMDHPLRRGLVDTILETGNGFLRTLKGRGAIIDGNFYYDETKNPSSELAGGHLTVGYKFMPTSPMERLSYEAYIDINLASFK